MPELGPAGPFPDASLRSDLERRWLHYAFRSNDGRHSMVANLSTLGASADGVDVQRMSILLLHDRDAGWSSSQFNAVTDPEPWSSFRLPEPGPPLTIRAVAGRPAVRLQLTRTGRPCTSQCAAFGRQQHLRWQSEPGIHAVGDVATRPGGRRTRVRMVGYHERVRGRWGWPELGGWVFGFSNAESASGVAPRHSVVFTLIQPPDPPDAPTASVMVWRDGRLLRHFPRRRVDVAVSGHLSRDRVFVCPPLAATLGTPPTSAVPGRLVITCRMGDDRLALDITAETAARIVNPSESGIAPFSVHEVLGPCEVTGTVAGRNVDFRAGAVVEFAGGAVAD